jgi:3-oxoacyl-[acyl-carrier protein] reductase
LSHVCFPDRPRRDHRQLRRVGTITTETLDGLLDDATCRMLEKRIPAGRIGLPADIAAAAAFFASAEASFVTGQSLIIDGGQTLPEIQ